MTTEHTATLKQETAFHWAGQSRKIAPWIGRALFVMAGALLLVSLALPYWRLVLFAPQYPGGLRMQAYATRLTGDVREIDGLNHYIGMRKLESAARVERTLARYAVPVLAALIAVAAFLPTRWAWVPVVLLLAYPLVFVADLAFWLYYAGHTLDPTAAIRLKPFTPSLLGEGKIAQFRTLTQFGIGFYLAAGAAITGIMATLFRWWEARVAVRG
ncbi:MAG: cytochrome C [Dehalococcoidia bacterium]